MERPWKAVEGRGKAVEGHVRSWSAMGGHGGGRCGEMRGDAGRWTHLVAFAKGGDVRGRASGEVHLIFSGWPLGQRVTLCDVRGDEILLPRCVVLREHGREAAARAELRGGLLGVADLIVDECGRADGRDPRGRGGPRGVELRAEEAARVPRTRLSKDRIRGRGR